MQRTLVLLKPDAVERGLVGEITSRLERKGLRFAAIKLMRVTEELALRHYEEHVGKPFFEGLVGFITSSPIVAMVLEGPPQPVRELASAVPAELEAICEKAMSREPSQRYANMSELKDDEVIGACVKDCWKSSPFDAHRSTLGDVARPYA